MPKLTVPFGDDANEKRGAWRTGRFVRVTL
jgi:hypothetical protein